MSHELETNKAFGNDTVVLAKERAWHGYGHIIPEHVTPTEALAIGKADYGIRQLKLKAYDPETGFEMEVDDKVMNVREDSFQSVLGLKDEDGFEFKSSDLELGIVSNGYKVFSNHQVAEFCEALSTADNKTNVKIETMGTIRGGKKIWFLLRGDEFQVAQGDGVVPYVLVSNGHDGFTGLRVTPTTIRVVCSNTLHAVIPDGRQRAHRSHCPAAITIEHVGNLEAKIEAAKLALAQYDSALNQTRSYMDMLAAKSPSTDALAQFWAANYNRDFRAVDPNDTSKKQQRRMELANEAFGKMRTRFEKEEGIAGATWWNALNAYTGYVQNDRQRKVSKRDNNLVGGNSVRTQRAFELALSLVS